MVVEAVLHRRVVAVGGLDVRAVATVRVEHLVVAVRVRQLAQARAVHGGRPRILLPGHADAGLGAGDVEATVHRELVFGRVARVALEIMLLHPGVGAVEDEITGTGLQAVAQAHVDARGRLTRHVDRVDVHAVQAAVGGAGHPRQRVHAGRRGDVGVAEAAVRFAGQDRAHVHVLHLLAHVDVEPVHRQVEAGGRRPDEACAPRGAGFRVELAVAAAAADHVALVVGAVIGVVGTAAVQIFGRGLVVARAGEHVVQVGRAEGGAVGAAHQQAVDGTPLQAAAPGRLADGMAGVAVLVVAAGHAQVQRVVQRQAQLGGGRPAVARTLAVRILPAVVVVLGRQRIGIQSVGLLAHFHGRGEAGITAGQAEQRTIGQGQGRGLGARLRRVGRACGDRLVLGAGQRPVQARRVGVVDREAIIVLAQLRPQEQVVGLGGDDLRPADPRPVLRVAQRRFVIPVAGQVALEAGGHAEGLLRAAHHGIAQAAHLLGRELALPEFDLTGGLVVEVARLVAVGGHAAPRGDIAHQGQRVVPHLHVGKPLLAVVEVVAQRGIAVGAAALAEDGAVADRRVAAAVVAIARAEGMVRAALVLPGQRFAGGRARVQVVVVVVGAQVGAAGDARAFGRPVLGRILDVALIGPQRRLRLQLDAVHRIEIALAEAAGQAHVERLAPAFAGGAHAHVDGGAVGLLLQDEVDHAGDRIRTVDGRRAAGQHLDAVDHAQRDVGHVGEVAAALERHREISDAAAVDQH